MRRAPTRLILAFQAARQLGARQAAWYALYQFGLRSGHYRRATPISSYQPWLGELRSPFRLPERASLEAVLSSEARHQAIAEAEEILFGQQRLFGGPSVLLNLRQPLGIDAHQHWAFYEGHPERAGVDDFKFLWEPARFGFVFALARAYALTGEERYPATFWALLEIFLHENPPNRGAQWASAQEVALRMAALLFAAGVFGSSRYSSQERMARLGGVIAAHAQRIPPTLPYARAQNNNHLLSEALGLIAAAAALPDHPQAAQWETLGQRCLNAALVRQIHPDGVYAQHSSNYHRLMLHAALMARAFGAQYSAQALERLEAATNWLLAQMDLLSGRVPNLGANDGANLLPLAASGFDDFRPTAQAAGRAFLGRAVLPPGAWDELSLWLNLNTLPNDDKNLPVPTSPAVHRLGDAQNWATIRAAQFHERPSHADQLHVEIWWRGENIARDAGTYRYTAEPPWDHGLARTLVHNTLTIHQQDQMRRAGRFLWLDWAQAEQKPGSTAPLRISARHNGYRWLGLTHQRTLEKTATGWLVTDQLLPLPGQTPKAFHTELHWLLPDWPWQIQDQRLILQRPSGGSVQIELSIDTAPSEIQLVRAGVLLAGSSPAEPLRGWYSPTYSIKTPALSLTLISKTPAPCTLLSRWSFPSEAEY